MSEPNFMLLIHKLPQFPFHIQGKTYMPYL